MESKFEPRKFEEEILAYWEENQIYKKLKEYNSKLNRKFLFIDGPPYPSAPVPHIGTVWNKVIKDSILRFRRLQGYRVNDQPGYDTHGLPIEVAVERQLNVSRKGEILEKVGVESFVNMCKNFALNNLRSLTENFKNVGVFMDWENPYLTLDPIFISNSWAVIKRAHERGMLKKDVQVLHWCPRCETTLSDYEVSEYRDIEDPSIYVKFKVRGSQNKYLVIWTTTPWTLPSNVFTMINGNAEYAEVEANGEVYIIASKRIETVMKESGIAKYKILRTFKGKEILGLEYEHPLEDLVSAQRNIGKYHVVVDGGADVTLEEGTGLVHSAPGHGDVDFEKGKQNGMPVVMLVDDRGQFIEEAGKYKGLNVRDASQIIIDDLRQKNALLSSGKIVHRYPVCWRCKSPLILRAINQWFIKVTQLKSDLIKEIERVNWIPSWGKTRIENMTLELRDWVISRQRFWGNPLPIWVCEEGHLNVVGNVEELKEMAVNQVPEDLHKPWIDNVVVRCKECGKYAKRVPDVADVWFDSGVAFFASLGRDWKTKWDELGPVDLVLEGHDQLRGWFFSLLRTGVILIDRAPYESVLVHGFMLDEQGREMHKSLGNYVEPSAVISKFGRDVLRLTLLRNTTWEDAKFSWKNLELNLRDLQIAWNVFLFASMYMNLDNFDPIQMSLDEALQHARIEDKWLLSRFYSMQRRIYEAMRDYKVHDLANELFTFLVEDVSRFYLRLARKRAWDEGITKDKLSLYTILYNVLKDWLIISSSVIPFFAEKVYQKFVTDKKPSVSMEILQEPKKELISKEIESIVEIAKNISEASLNARAKANIKLRWPISVAYILFSKAEYVDKIKPAIELLKTLLNVKRVELYDISMLDKFSELIVEPDKGAIGKEFKKLSPKVIKYVESEKQNIAKDILKEGQHKAMIEGTEVILTREHIKVREEVKSNYSSSSFADGMILIPREIGEQEEEEGLIRDIVRRIQYMRKMANLNVTDYVTVFIKGPDDKLEVLNKYRTYLMSETRAKSVEVGKVGGDLVNSWDIEGEEYTIGIKKEV
ncbi:isoleucine--tRNA ligase [Metallosphaera tengchongensis]|uniref:Isoleucine--tRNA ligase n=1 Tax=Metallosphaera tengchongensis TaxID=1532350 RepID=A0A6N0NVU4_9CREN|nr:isoleucine--tRNA ligase [Metallosphaera tengchongensis]QKR01024.1 isoleucine--tRNA ligase [Metallosphaera tengchongensis]